MSKIWIVLALCAVGCLVPVRFEPPDNPAPVVVPMVDQDGPSAWVVTEKLPEPDFPYVPSEPDEPLNPEFVPDYGPTACPCGCGKIGCGCGKSRAVGCSAKTESAAAPALLSVDETALQAAQSQGAAGDPVVAYAPPWCHGACAWWEKYIGTGDAELRIEWRHEEFPAEIRAQTNTAPAFVYRGVVLFTSPSGQNLATMKARVAGMRGGKVAAVGAIGVGTIRGRDAVRVILDAVSRRPDSTAVLQFGGASIILPAKLKATVEFDGAAMRCGFDQPLPSVRYGSGVFSVLRPVRFVSTNRDVLTVGVDGFPDLAFRLE